VLINSAKSENSFKEEELHCIVCFELPPTYILQCENGHLMCQECFDKVVDYMKPTCPTCRVKLNRDLPTRNLFAETVLSSLLVPCPNDGCQLTVNFKNVKAHSTGQCGFRKAQCKFATLGCDWKGLEKARRPHEKKCAILVSDVQTLLKKVQERNQEKEEERKKWKKLMQVKERCVLCYPNAVVIFSFGTLF